MAFSSKQIGAIVTDELDKMWAALEAHQPATSYAEAWAIMLRERTQEAARAAAYAADAAWAESPARASSVAARAAEGAAWAAGAADAAQRAINVIRGVQT